MYIKAKKYTHSKRTFHIKSIQIFQLLVYFTHIQYKFVYAHIFILNENITNFYLLYRGIYFAPIYFYIQYTYFIYIPRYTIYGI